MYILDQHAAHERIMYEKVKKNYYSETNKDSQMLLLPDIITLTHKEMDIAKDNMKMFEQAGFSLEEFGENTIKLTGVPTVCIDLDTKELFLETLDEINTVARTAKQEKESASPFNQLIQEARRLAGQRAENSKKETSGNKKPLPETHRIYRFPSLAQVMDACSKIYPLYEGNNTLYRDFEESFYYLIIERGDHPQEDFKRIGNVLSEFALQIPYSYGTHAYFDEHFTKIIEYNAINTLASL